MPLFRPVLMSMTQSAGRLAVGLLIAAAPFPAVAQQSGGSGLGGPGTIQLRSSTETLLILGLDIRVSGSTGSAARDEAMIDGLRRGLAIRAGDRLTQLALDTIVGQLVAAEGIVAARAFFTTAEEDPSRAQVVVDVTLGPDVERDAGPAGMLAGEGLSGFPVIWRSETAGLRFILNGGLGVFTDGNPWFGNPDAFTIGNPLVQDPAEGADTGGRIAWFEQWIEGGIAGATQLGESNVAVYGALTAIAPFATGQDIFRDDTRSTVDVEKAYAGFVWSEPARELSFNLSLGRQNFTLNDGFLISQFGSQWNAGPRPGVYMAPRTTHDFAGVATLKAGGWTATGFYLDPNEYEPLETDTTVAGASLRYNFTDSFFADASAFTVPESKARYGAPTGPVGTREGLTTYAPTSAGQTGSARRVSGSRARLRTSAIPISRWTPGRLTRRSAIWRATCPGRPASPTGSRASPATIPRPRPTNASTRFTRAACRNGCSASRSERSCGPRSMLCRRRISL
jgi:hypothetical protein